jgi:hypothetical protein
MTFSGGPVTSSGTLTMAGTLAVANGGTGVTTSTGSGSNVLSTSPTLVTPVLGTPTSVTLTNATGLPVGGISATGTPSSTTYLRGDGSWSTGSGGGSGTVTSVAVSGGTTGLTTSGGPVTTSGTITLAGTLAVANGGTNATTASAARTSLGAAASGANTDITSIALTTGTVTTTPAATTDLANKNYVDASVAGLTSQAACQYATAADLGAVTYSNGTSGVGATLTKTSPFATLSIDGSPTVGQRILVKSQTTTLQNGAYTVTNVGSGSTGWVLTRATDYDQSAEISAGDAFYVVAGSTLANTTWVQQTPSPVTVGTTAITFIQFGGASTAGIKQPYAANGAVYATSTTALTTGTLPITGGGTGATTASTALSNLGGASTGKAIAMSIVFGGG